MIKKTFNYKYKLNNRTEQIEINYDIELPTRIPLNEYCLTILNEFKVPIYLKDELENELNKFLKCEQQNLYDNVVESMIKNAFQNGLNKETIRSYWLNLYKTSYKSELIDKIKSLEINNDELKMHKLYHKLIHSEMMQVILNKEREYALDMNNLRQMYKKLLKNFELDKQNKLEHALKLNTNNRQMMPDYVISQLAQENVELIELEKSKLFSKIDNLKLIQKNEFKSWLYRLDTDQEYRLMEFNEFLKQQEHHFKQMSDDLSNSSNNTTNESKLEESYTIQLGAQLKSTHNLRLIKCDILDYCRNRFNLNAPNSILNFSIEPQTIQTSMQLYSNTSLCACVLLIDCNLRKFNKISEQFVDIVDESTELHFKTFEQQLSDVELCLDEFYENRKLNKDVNNDNNTTASLPTSPSTPSINSLKSALSVNEDFFSNNSSSSNGSNEEKTSNRLQIGDFYITKHSNLSQVHLVFHLAYDNDLSKQRTDQMSSRHPIIMGLRNILKACFKYNITTLTIPLLLSHETSEEMTINWVMKRAELVLKCLKGFMIEFVQWSSLESRTLQFVLPHGLLDETFHSISNLIKTIFRESRVVNLT